MPSPLEELVGIGRQGRGDLALPAKGREKKSVHAEQTVSEMALEVLVRQAKALAKRSGLLLDEALVEVLKSEAGCQLSELAEGSHRHEKASQWQAGLIGERLRNERANGEAAHAKYGELLEKEFVRFSG